MSKTIFYPKAQKLIESMGIEERIQNNPKINLQFRMSSSILKSEAQKRYFAIKNEFLGFNEELEEYAQTIKDMLWYPTKYSFILDGKKIPLDIEDVSILMGWEASHILTPEEFINYRNFGVDSLSEFLGVIGSYMKDLKSQKTGSKFQSEFNTKLYETMVSGTHYKDPFFSQIDITSYDSIDPFRNKISYRKLREEDKTGFIGVERSEPDILIVLLKYLDSISTNEEFKEKTDSLLGYAKELSQSRLLYAALDPQSKLENSKLFQQYGFPMQTVSSDKEIINFPFDTFRTNSGKQIYIAKDEKNNLLIGRRNETFFTPSMYFSPEDAQKLVKSLMHHCAQGQSLTSLQELVNPINYRFSNEFLEQQKYINLD